MDVYTFGAMMLVAYLVEALWFPGHTFSNGQFSCRVAPLCLLGLEVRTGRSLVGRVGMNCRCHIVSDLFQTLKMNAWCWWIRVCFWILPSEARKNGLEAKLKPDWHCRRHGGGMMCLYTDLPIHLSIYLSICLSVSI